MYNFLRFWVCVFYFLFLIFSFSVPAKESFITKIDSNRNLGFDYVDIYTTGMTEGKGLLLEDKLIIEFPGVSISGEVKISKSPSKRIKNIYVEAGRIIIELKKEVEYEIANIFGRGKTEIEIYDQGYTAFPREFEWEKQSLRAKAPPLKEKKLEPLGKNLLLSGKIIVVDPAHGGGDPGAFSKSGIPEKHFTLAVARKLARLLQKAGATVYLTRDEDRQNNLSDIVALTNRVSANLFISIHFNAAHQEKISGTETYYFNRDSRRLAGLVHKNLVYGIKRRDRGLQKMMFYVVHHSKVPAVLIEPLYLTNAEEEKLIRNPGFQNEMAWDLTKAVKEYFRNKPD